MKKIKSMRVQDIVIYPNETVPVTQIINKKGYELIRKMKAKDGYLLPMFGTLVKKDWGAEYLHTTDRYFEIIVMVRINGDLYRCYFKFTEEWITDLASVPKFFRSFVDDNAPWIIPACQVHDLLFVLAGAGLFDFRGTNKLFYHMCKWSIDNYMLKLSDCKRRQYKRKAWLAWLAINTFVGRKRFNVKREDWEKQGGEVLMERIYE